MQWQMFCLLLLAGKKFPEAAGIKEIFVFIYTHSVEYIQKFPNFVTDGEIFYIERMFAEMPSKVCGHYDKLLLTWKWLRGAVNIVSIDFRYVWKSPFDKR